MTATRFPAYLRLIGTAWPDAKKHGEPSAAVQPAYELDSATGVATRGALLDALDTMGLVAPRAPLSFVVVKVSGVSRCDGGDPLRLIAGRVKELVRATDMIGRLTGTSFGVALQGTGVTAAAAVAARLMHHLNRLQELDPAICITVSAATGTGINAETLPIAAMDTCTPCCS